MGDLEAAERSAQVFGVAAQAGQPAALAHRLGGGLVRAAGARDHGGARGLALEAVQLLAAPHAAAWPEPPRAAGPRRPELAGSAGPPHRRRRLTARPWPAPLPPPPPPPPLLSPPLGCSGDSVRSGSAPAASAAEREGGGSRLRGEEAGAGAAGREGAERVPLRLPLGGAPRLGRDRGGGSRLGALGGGASGEAGRRLLGPRPYLPVRRGTGGSRQAWGSPPARAGSWGPRGMGAKGRVKVNLKDTELLSQGAALASLLEEVGSPAGRLGDLPVKTKMCCANPCSERWLAQGGFWLEPSKGLGSHPERLATSQYRGQGLSAALVKLTVE